MKNKKMPIQYGEIGLLALLALLWGSSYFLTKIAVETIPPITLIAVRVSIAALFLSAVVLWRRETFPSDLKSWRMLFVQALFNSIGAWTVLAWGQQFVDSGLASVLNSTSPIFVFFITLFITRHESANVTKLFGACLGVAGVVGIVGIDVFQDMGGQGLALGAVLFGALLYACAAIYGRRFAYLPSTVTAAGTMIWASVCLVPISLYFEKPWTIMPTFTALIATAILSVFCTAFALLLYFRLVRTLGSMGVASQSYLRAGVGVLLGVFVLGEQMTINLAFGLMAVILGVAVINLPVRTNR